MQQDEKNKYSWSYSANNRNRRLYLSMIILEYIEIR